MRAVAACLTAAVLVTLPVLPAAQSDLDQLMASVIARRDDNWKKLEQYTLLEDNTFRLTGPMETPLYGGRREYFWVPREGFFVRSPVSADGVAIGAAERKQAEDAWLAQERRREQRRAARAGQPEAAAAAGSDVDAGNIPDVIRQSVEPQFVRAAYFMKFRFEGGHYAFVGRERVLDRDVLRVEYYPEQLFRNRRPNDRPDAPRAAAGTADRARDDRDDQITRQMNKVSQVTLWVEPNDRQILQYEFQNIDADFLPGRWLLRLDGLKASMRMGTPFPGIWLPASVKMRVEMTVALGRVLAEYEANYRDYRLAETSSRVVIP